jgi:hypothetical protein
VVVPDEMNMFSCRRDRRPFVDRTRVIVNIRCREVDIEDPSMIVHQQYDGMPNDTVQCMSSIELNYSPKWIDHNCIARSRIQNKFDNVAS